MKWAKWNNSSFLISISDSRKSAWMNGFNLGLFRLILYWPVSMPKSCHSLDIQHFRSSKTLGFCFTLSLGC